MLCAAATVWSVMRHRNKLRAPKQDAAQNTIWRGNKYLTLFLSIFFIFAITDSWKHSALGATFPMAMAILSLSFCILYLWRQRTMTPQTAVPAGETSAPAMMLSMLWLIGLTALTGVVGFAIAITALFAALLKLKARASWLMTATLSLCGIGGMLLVAYYARMDFPWGLLQHHTDLPWPLG